MSRDEQDQRPQDLEETNLDTEIDAEDALDDEDLEQVAGGWTSDDGGG